jgi:uncharacterized protein YndB with AHSA1/START domain
VSSVIKEILVQAPVERAFRVFTENMVGWWPSEHHIGKAALKEIVLEKFAGGRWYEVGDDGSQCEWGKVLVWEPPRRVVMAWQLNGEWKYDKDFSQDVAVTFVAEGMRATRVRLEHKDLERYGEAHAAIGKSLDEGWGGILKSYAARTDATENVAQQPAAR